MKLLLTSTGLPPEYSQFFLNKLNKAPSGTKVAFIPTAADPEDDKWFVDASLKQLYDLNFPVEIVDLKDNQEKIKDKLINSQIIYIGGGNTYYLLKWIRQSGLHKYLKKLLDEGRIYLGGSAGTLVVCPEISASSWGRYGDKNIVNLSDLKGLNLVDFIVYPHYVDNEKNLIDEKSKSLTCPIIPISDTQAIWWEDGHWEVIGK